MILKLVCRLGGHSIDRKRVWHDTLNYRTTCARCGTSLLRGGGGGGGSSTRSGTRMIAGRRVRTSEKESEVAAEA